MPDWPTNGETDWNTKMLANLAVGHDTDGTHKKSQMLTDMEWSPTAYVAGESVTFPNGLILKQGDVTSGAGTGTVTYAVAFPTAVKTVMLTAIDAGAPQNDMSLDPGADDATFDWNKNTTTDGFFWQAWGY